MHIPPELRCLFTATVEDRDGKYVVAVPDSEIELGDLHAGDRYRVAIISEGGVDEHPRVENEAQSPRAPPVSEGETRIVEIEDLGEQGDGITRVERGFVVIVPDIKPGGKSKSRSPTSAKRWRLPRWLNACMM